MPRTAGKRDARCHDSRWQLPRARLAFHDRRSQRRSAMEHRRLSTGIVWALFALALPACDFHPQGTDNLDAWLPWRDEVPFVTPSSERSEEIFSSPGELAVHHGETCALGEKTLKVRQQLFVPREFDRGTVLFNGYRLKYRDDQSYVKALASGIGSITVQPGMLSWEAAGVLADRGYDDVIEWCYTYTAVVWSSTALEVVADHDDPMHVFQDGKFNTGSALRPIPGFLRNPAFVGSPEVAILPRGFLATVDRPAHPPPPPPSPHAPRPWWARRKWRSCRAASSPCSTATPTPSSRSPTTRMPASFSWSPRRWWES